MVGTIRSPLLTWKFEDLTHQFQVHADASNFAEGITKEQAYQQVLDQAEGLFFEQRNWVSVRLPEAQNQTFLSQLYTVQLKGSIKGMESHVQPLSTQTYTLLPIFS
jgi:hypothetical protein